MNRNVHPCQRNLLACIVDRAWADVEGGDLRRPLLGCRDRHDTAAGTQVGDAAAACQPGLLHDVDQQLGVFLRRIDAVGDNGYIQVGVGGGQHRPFQKSSAVNKFWINAQYRRF